MISIHALREEGDGLRHGTAAPPEDFYPRPPRGGRLGQDGRRATDWLFLSTPSARRATCPVRMMCRIEEFLSTPSARRATPERPRSRRRREFLSTPSARRATTYYCHSRAFELISIHALREEGDHDTCERYKAWQISIHALREEGDGELRFALPSYWYFYPRPPRGGRLKPYFQKSCDFEFLSTPSARRATGANHRKDVFSIFLSTPSARRATAKTETKSLFSYKLYNILHEFRRALIYNGSKNDPNHAK